MTIKNQAINMACCCVSVKIEMSNPIPKITNKYTAAKLSTTQKLPKKGMPNTSLAKPNPNNNSNKAITQKGNSFPIIK